MSQLAISSTPELENQVARLEKEIHNIIKRLEKVERVHRFSLAAFLANVLLLVSLGILAGYLGFYPPGVERLPLKARTVEADQITIRSADGTVRGHLTVDDKGAHFVDDQGKPLARP
jgi:hypothetical protein